MVGIKANTVVLADQNVYFYRLNRMAKLIIDVKCHVHSEQYILVIVDILKKASVNHLELGAEIQFL